MPYERVHIEGTNYVIVRTDGCNSLCEPGKIVEVPTIQEWKGLLPRFSRAQAEDDPKGEFDVLKHSKTNMVAHAHIALDSRTLSYVMKYSTVWGWKRRLQFILRRTRERKLFGIARKVMEVGIPTAVPVAIIETTKPHLRGCMLMEYVAHLQDLDLVCIRQLVKMPRSLCCQVKTAIIHGIISMFEAFRQGGYFHRDMKASNVVVFGDLQEPASIRVGLVDLEGVRSCGGRSLKRWRDALIRLAASLGGYESVTRTDYLRFLRTFLVATGQSNTNWKSEFSKLSIAAQQYSTRSKGRKGNKLDGYQ